MVVVVVVVVAAVGKGVVVFSVPSPCCGEFLPNFPPLSFILLRCGRGDCISAAKRVPDEAEVESATIYRIGLNY